MSKKYRVTSPDGKKYEVTAPDDATEEQILQYAQQNMPRRSPRTMSEELRRQVGLTARAGIEGTLGIPLAVTDAPHRIARALGYRGGKTAGEALSSGLSSLGLPEAETPTERVVQDITGAMTGTGGLAKLAGKGMVRLSELLSGGASGGLAGGAREAGAPEWAQTLAGLAPMARGSLGLKAPGPESIRSPGQSVRLRTFQQAHESGYKFPPSVIERGMLREEIESIGGKDALKQQTSLHNQQVTNQIAKKGAGLRPEQELTEANLAQARDDLAEPYRQVAALSPNAAQALESWKDANAQAKLHWKDYQANQTASAFRKYERFNNRAEADQAAMEAEAVRTGNPQLVQELRDARVKIAQNWDVDRALNVATGDVRANVLGSMLDKRGEKGMSGPLGIIAKTQQAFPEHMKETAKTSTPGVSKLSFLASGALGLEGYHALGLKGLALGLALPQFSRGARALSMRAMQGPRSQQGIPLSALTSYLAQRQERE